MGNAEDYREVWEGVPTTGGTSQDVDRHETPGQVWEQCEGQTEGWEKMQDAERQFARITLSHNQPRHTHANSVRLIKMLAVVVFTAVCNNDVTQCSN